MKKTLKMILAGLMALSLTACGASKPTETSDSNAIKGLEDVDPMVFPYLEPGLGLREDEPGETLKTEEVLQNASETMMNMVKVKKVVG